MKARPTAPLWAKALSHLYNIMVKCTHCGMDYLWDGVGENVACPWCDKTGERVFVLKDGENVVFARECFDGAVFEVPENVFLPFDIATFGRAFLTVKVNIGQAGDCVLEFSKGREGAVFDACYSFVVTSGGAKKEVWGKCAFSFDGNLIQVVFKDKKSGLCKEFVAGIVGA